MLSGFTGTEVHSFTAFHSELVKIAEEEKKPSITKARLKRLAIAAPVAAVGAGLGHAGGRALGNYIRGARGQELAKSLVRQGGLGRKVVGALPAVAGGLLAGGATLTALKNKKVKKYVMGDDERS